MPTRKVKKPAGKSDSMALMDALVDLKNHQAELGRQIASLQEEYTRTLEAIAALKAVISRSPTGFAFLTAMHVFNENRARAATGDVKPGEIQERARQLIKQIAPTFQTAPVDAESEVQFRRGSLPHLARAILRAEGFPLHTDAIASRMNLGGHSVNRDSLVTALARLAADRRAFYRVEGEPNKFGLVEWLRNEEPKQPRPSPPAKEKK